MTLIARLAINDFPMLVGDLLLSGPSVPDTQDDVPTTENLTAIFPAGSTYVPRGLRQKIAVVADNLVVGWTGRLITAQEVIAELRRKSCIPTVHIRHAHEALRQPESVGLERLRSSWLHR